MNFLPKEEKFFALFSEQITLIKEASQVFLDGVRKGSTQLPEMAKTIEKIENKGDKVIHELVEALNRTFITPLDPEDIHSLASHLDDVLDGIEDSAHCIVAYKVDPVPAVVVDLAEIIQQCSEELDKAFSALQSNKDVMKHCIEINRLEGKADYVARQATADLMNNETNLILVLKLKEIYSFLEETTDAFEDVADLIQEVVVKNS